MHIECTCFLISGGFAGLYSQFGAYQKWCRTTSVRAQFYQKTLEMVDLIDDPDTPRAGRHRELEKAEIKKGEAAVQRVITAVNNFTNPFTIVDHEKLYSIASGAPVSPDVEKDVLQAESVGKAGKADFIKRLQSGEPVSFFDPIKRKKLKTMEASNKKVMLTSSKGKVTICSTSRHYCTKCIKICCYTYLLIIPAHPVPGAKQHRIPAPCQVTEARRTIGSRRTHDIHSNACTSQPWHTRWIFLEDQQSYDSTPPPGRRHPENLPYPKDALFIQDGMALLHILTNLPPTCREICLQVLDQMVAKKDFLFSTDSYHPESIKAQERLRRGSSEKIIVAGPATRKPYDFKVFLANDDNKKQLCQLMLRVWSGQSAASRLARTNMAVIIVEGRAHRFVSSNGEVSLNAHNMILVLLFYYRYIQKPINY